MELVPWLGWSSLTASAMLLSLLASVKDVLEGSLSAGVLCCGLNIGLQLMSGLAGLCEVTSWIVQ